MEQFSQSQNQEVYDLWATMGVLAFNHTPVILASEATHAPVVLTIAVSKGESS